MKYLLIFVIIFFIGCNKHSDIYIDNYTLELDARLDSTSDGIYKLKLTGSPNSIQTIHRISGKLLNNDIQPITPQLINWESSHVWFLNDTAYYIVRRILTLNGEWVIVDTSYVTGFNGYEVPTINSHSYSGTDGEINTVIAPILSMKYDTMLIICTYKNISKTLKIKLE